MGNCLGYFFLNWDIKSLASGDESDATTQTTWTHMNELQGLYERIDGMSTTVEGMTKNIYEMIDDNTKMHLCHFILYFILFLLTLT
ncbi:hypothetical protein ACJX0J_007685, partial [Zea mays]